MQQHYAVFTSKITLSKATQDLWSKCGMGGVFSVLISNIQPFLLRRIQDFSIETTRDSFFMSLGHNILPTVLF